MTDELNILLSKMRKDLDTKPFVKKGIDYMIANLKDIKDEYKFKLRFYGGCYLNHEFMWDILDHTHNHVSENLTLAINADFGSWENMLKEINDNINSLHGSGWIWLCLRQNNTLIIMKTFNEDHPTMFGLRPIFGIDLWEHAYFNDYPMKKSEYVENYMDVIDWDAVDNKYIEAQKYFTEHAMEYQEKMDHNYYESISKTEYDEL